jgi:hypothetical protein
MKNLKLQQHGWTRVQDHGPLLLIEDKDKNCYHIPTVLCDALATATYNAETYRKSRNYFQQAREEEKINCSKIHKNIVENNIRVNQELNNEVEYYRNELNKVQGLYRDMKGYNLMLGTLLSACIIYLCII